MCNCILQASPGMPNWMRKFQAPGHDMIFPEHQTSFSERQLSQLPPPVHTTSQMCSAGASVLPLRPSFASSSCISHGTTYVYTDSVASADRSAAQVGPKPRSSSAPIFTRQSSGICDSPTNIQQIVGTQQSDESLNQSADVSGFEVEMGDY